MSPGNVLPVFGAQVIVGDDIAATNRPKWCGALLELPLVSTLTVQRVEVAQMGHHALLSVLQVKQDAKRAHVFV